jgi:hypothetical protein
LDVQGLRNVDKKVLFLYNPPPRNLSKSNNIRLSSRKTNGFETNLKERRIECIPRVSPFRNIDKRREFQSRRKELKKELDPLNCFG